MSDNADTRVHNTGEALKGGADRWFVVALARHLMAEVQRRTGATRGRRSGTYASRRLGAITFSLMPPLHTLPPQVQAQQQQVRAAAAQLETRLARAPVAREVAADLGWTLPELFHRMVAAGAGGLRATDAPIEEMDEMADPSRIASGRLSLPLGAGTARRRLAAFARAFDDLADREQLVLRMACEHRMSQEQMALVLGDSTERVGELHDGAVACLLGQLKSARAGIALSAGGARGHGIAGGRRARHAPQQARHRPVGQVPSGTLALPRHWPRSRHDPLQ